MRCGVENRSRHEPGAVDIEITASNGTPLAEKFALVRPGRTNFAGFLMPEAALQRQLDVRRGRRRGRPVRRAALADLRAKVAPELENADMSEDQVKLVKHWLDDVIGVFEKTADNRQYDGGLAVLLEPAGATVVAGGAVADGAKLEKVLKQFVEEAKKSDPDIASLIKLNAAKHEGVRFHKVSIADAQAGTRAVPGRDAGNRAGNRRRQALLGRRTRCGQVAEKDHQPIEGRRRQGSAADADERVRRVDRKVRLRPCPVRYDDDAGRQAARSNPWTPAARTTLSSPPRPFIVASAIASRSKKGC